MQNTTKVVDSNGNGTQLKRSVSLIGATALVVGAVIGMGIYALVASVAANVGTTIWLPFILAMFIMMFGVFPMVQIGAALPRAGAGYVYTSRLLKPVVGTMVSWLAIFAVNCSLVFVSMGMAGYVAPYLPFDIPVSVLSIIIPVIFLMLYLFSFRLATLLQVILTAILLLALLIYGVGGAASTELKITTHLPYGVGGLIMGCILCYTAWFGLNALMEIGEEVKNAKRNIPLALILGSLIILAIYIVVGTVFASSVVGKDSEAIKAMQAPLIDSGRVFLHPWLLVLLAFGGVAAALTSFNAAAIAIPREIFAQARDGIMPQVLAKISPKTDAPNNAVIATFGIVFAMLIIGNILGLSIDFFAVLTAQGVLLLFIFVGAAALYLPKKLPEYYNNAYFKMPIPVLWIIAILTFITCGGIFSLMLMEMAVAGVIIAAVVVAAAIFHVVRVSMLKKQGVDWDARMAALPGYDEE
jgi:APA family basic amino acid/polyamine antiporter